MSYSRSLGICALALLLVPHDAGAGPHIDGLLKTTSETLQRLEASVPDWRMMANWYLALAILVALLGIAAGALQAWGSKNDPATKALTTPQKAGILVGALITGLTVIMNLAFAADHREYRKSATRVTALSTQIKGDISGFRTDPDVVAWERLLTKSETAALTPGESDQLRNLYASTFEKNGKIKTLVGELEGLETRLAMAAPLPGTTVLNAAGPSDLSVHATGESNDPWQAEQNALATATERMVAQLASRAKIKPSDQDRAGLRDYLARYARHRTTRTTGKGDRVRATTELLLPLAYADPALVVGYTRVVTKSAARTTEQIIESARQQSRGRPLDGFIEVTVTLRPPTGKVALAANDPEHGSFVGHLTVTPARAGGHAQLRLDSLEVHKDSSTGSTRWSFYVLSQGRVIITVPEQRWDESKKPTISWWDADAGLTGQASMARSGVTVTVVGLKPKVVETFSAATAK